MPKLWEELKKNGEWDPRTEEEKTELGQLKQQLDELQTRYDNGEEDLSDEISDLENEIDELETKPDIYSIAVSQYSYYGMTAYEFDNAEYAVGTESEIENAAKSSTENLLDDVGYEGFNQSFVENFVDDNKIEEYVRDFFDYDIRENPESYLDDDERELSSSQEKKFLNEVNKYEKKVNSQISRQVGGDPEKKPERKRYNASSSSSSDSDSDDEYFNFGKYRRLTQPISFFYYTPSIYKVNSVFLPTFNVPLTPYVKLWLPMY